MSAQNAAVAVNAVNLPPPPPAVPQPKTSNDVSTFFQTKVPGLYAVLTSSSYIPPSSFVPKVRQLFGKIFSQKTPEQQKASFDVLSYCKTNYVALQGIFQSIDARNGFRYMIDTSGNSLYLGTIMAYFRGIQGLTGSSNFAVNGRYLSLVGQNNFSALKPNESFSEARNRLRTFKPGQFNKASNYLELFPHWAGEAGQKIAKQTGQTKKLTNLLDTVQDKTSPYFIVQSQLGNASWNSEVKTWQGKAVDQLRSKIDSADEKYVKSYSKASSLVNQQLSITQVQSQIPQVVKDIVNANDTISSAGFGPKRAGGIALYAGRWVDPATGNVRLLPRATLNYVNPLSLEQKRAYHQARLLNYWNNFIDQVQFYQDSLKQDPKAYRTKAITGITKAYNQKKIQKQQYLRNARLYLQSLARTLPSGGKKILLDIVYQLYPDDVLRALFSISSQQTNQSLFQVANRKFAQMVIQAYQKITEAFRQRVNKDDFKAVGIIAAVGRAVNDMGAYSYKKQINLLKKVGRSVLIPTNNNYDDVQTGLKSYKTLQSQVKRFTTSDLSSIMKGSQSLSALTRGLGNQITKLPNIDITKPNPFEYQVPLFKQIYNTGTNGEGKGGENGEAGENRGSGGGGSVQNVQQPPQVQDIEALPVQPKNISPSKIQNVVENSMSENEGSQGLNQNSQGLSALYRANNQGLGVQ